MKNMGKRKNQTSEFNRRINQRILAEAGIRRLSARDIARQLGKSPSYVTTRYNETVEWLPADVEKLAHAWNMTPEELIAGQNGYHSTQSVVEQQLQAVLRKINSGDLTLAANHDPNKQAESESEDGC